jgi:hypothetical protein
MLLWGVFSLALGLAWIIVTITSFSSGRPNYGSLILGLLYLGMNATITIAWIRGGNRKLNSRR